MFVYDSNKYRHEPNSDEDPDEDPGLIPTSGMNLYKSRSDRNLVRVCIYLKIFAKSAISEVFVYYYLLCRAFFLSFPSRTVEAAELAARRQVVGSALYVFVYNRPKADHFWPAVYG